MRELGCDAVIVRVDRVFVTTSRARKSDAPRNDDPVALARKQSLAAIVDIDLRRVPNDASVVTQNPAWFRRPGADADPRFAAAERTPGDDFAFARPEAGDAFVAWWIAELAAAAQAGFAGVRMVRATRFRPEILSAIVEGVRTHAPSFWLSVDTLGATPPQIAKLEGMRFDAAYSSLAWWDGTASWFYDEDARLRRIARDVVAVASCDGATARGAVLALGAEIADALLVSQSAASDANVSAAMRMLASRERRVRSVRPLLRNRRDVAVLLTETFGADAAAREILVANLAGARMVTLAVSDILAEAGAASVEACDGADAPPFVALNTGDVQRFVLRMSLPKPARAIAAPARAAAIESRIAIENVAPTLDGGRFAVKRTSGDRVTVAADLIVDGHEKIGAAVAWRCVDQRTWSRCRLAHAGNDRWTAQFQLGGVGRYEYFIEAWIDEFATLRDELEKKLVAGVLADVDLADARRFVEGVRTRARGANATAIRAIIAVFDAAASNEARAHALLDAAAASALSAANERPFLTVSPTYAVDAERLAARFSSWYELFPRSLGKNGAHGTFDDVVAHLPTIRAMGFDVLYMPPIHPIGRTHRKGRNNALTAAEGDVGSPYAIGSAEGGHDAVHPDLGGEAAFVRLVAAAKREGLEIALDFAVQASPDHPWLREHPEWFRKRADGTIRHAENPPKKYEDIVNVDFYADAAIPALWNALRDVIAHWAGLGVRVFRVDNPHTKPLPFWEWLIADIRARWPDAIFLAEAFTRPKLMYRLAKLGFSQSYTYFVWREDKAGLTSYLRELNEGVPRECFRPHFFVNTPDINPHVLQQGGRPAHLIRAALATTLSGLWGMYSGFELCEATPLPGREEYLDSEKYELRAWDRDRAGNIIAEISRLNAIRRMNPELQTHLDIEFLNADNEHVLYYAKGSAANGGLVLVAVNLDWRASQAANFEVPLWQFALPDDGSIDVEDLWTGATFAWHGKWQRVELGLDRPFALWRIRAGAPPTGAHA
ncbi:MAG: alpha-1,4-glucan--maltose-1-phosphate maltosyltransferase [Rhodanobacteraceae bacterium]